MFKIKLKFIERKPGGYIGHKICLKGNEEKEDKIYEFYEYDEKTHEYSIRNCKDHTNFSKNTWTHNQIKDYTEKKVWTLIQ